jgi:hypothetical protein
MMSSLIQQDTFSNVDVQSLEPVVSHGARSLEKLHRQVTLEQVANFDRSKPIYVDFGMSDASDTAFHLSLGDSVVSVDAYLPWVEKARERFQDEIQQNRLMLLNVGVGLEDSSEPMPLWYKEEGSVTSSFVKGKACSSMPKGAECMHTDVAVVGCAAILQLIQAAPELMKVDIEMLHHTCLRALHQLPSELLPKHVCWEEHDKPFGSARIMRPITDVKLILGLFELGYTSAKIIMQGPSAWRYYGAENRELIGHGQGSGQLLPSQQMHYHSNQDHEDGSFDTKWVPVNKILQQGVFGASPKKTYGRNNYFDVCMKLDNHPNRPLFQKPENFPLASYATGQYEVV